MLNIKIKNTVFKIDFIYKDDFFNAIRYETDEPFQYSINSYKKKYSIPDIKPNLTTKFYDYYYLGEEEIQIQKNQQNEHIGTIVYKGSTANLYLNFDNSVTEYVLSQYAVFHFLFLDNDCILMHGSSILYKNKGIIFTAKSGVGKSTHTRLWRNLSDAITINDDKNILSLKDDKVYLYSSPWSGKHRLDTNTNSTLDAIVFLYQNKENVVQRLKPLEGFKRLLSQIEALSEENKEYWNQITDRLLEVPMYLYGCNMENEAFEIIKNRLEKDLWE